MIMVEPAMKAKVFGLIASLALFGATPSEATTVDVTYTGTVSGIDTLGLFGAPGSDLSGRQYTANYLFDVAFGLNNYYVEVNTATQQWIYGGPYYSNTLSPSLGATFNIGGTSVSINGSSYSEIRGFNYGGTNGQTARTDYAVDSPGSSYVQNYIFNYKGIFSGLPPSITTAFSYTVTAGDTSGGEFCAIECLTLTPTSVSETVTPLPAALPLFATGLGALGLLGWRRKRKAAAASSTAGAGQAHPPRRGRGRRAGGQQGLEWRTL
jgi:hypothetical protein